MPTDRDDLARVLNPSGEGREIGTSWQGVVLHSRQALAIADAILAQWVPEHDRAVRERDAQIAESRAVSNPPRGDDWGAGYDAGTIDAAAAIRAEGTGR